MYHALKVAVALTSIYQLWDRGYVQKQGQDFSNARFWFNRELMFRVRGFSDVMLPEKRDSICLQGSYWLQLVSALGLRNFNKQKPAHVSLFAANTAESRARFIT